MSITRQHEQLFIAAFTEEAKDVPAVRIKVDGRFVKLGSGKSVWATLGHAKSALKNHLDSLPMYRVGLRSETICRPDGQYLPGAEGAKLWAAFLAHLQQRGILEFVTS